MGKKERHIDYWWTISSESSYTKYRELGKLSLKEIQ
jgi:hypothetical protein